MSSQTILLGLCGGLETVAAGAAAGADFLEVSVQGSLVPAEKDETRFEANLASSTGLPVPTRCANLFLPAGLPCVGPAAHEAALLAYAERVFARARRAGIGCIVFGSGGARAQFVALLKNIAPLAERENVTLAVEPLNVGECNFINTLEEGAEVVETCDHPYVMLLADTYQMGFAGEGRMPSGDLEKSCVTSTSPSIPRGGIRGRTGRITCGGSRHCKRWATREECPSSVDGNISPRRSGRR